MPLGRAGSDWKRTKEARILLHAEKLRARKEKYALRPQGGPPSPLSALATLRPEKSPDVPLEPVAKRPRTASPSPTPLPPPPQRVMEVAIVPPPSNIEEHRPSLDERLTRVCKKDHVEPWNFAGVWADERINVVIVQMMDTYGAHEALCGWIERLSPERVAKQFDFAMRSVNLPRFLASVWISKDERTGRGVVPVIVGATDELIGWLSEIVAKLPPRTQALTYQRVVLVADDAYGDKNNLSRLRRLEPVRVCKVGALGESCLRKCLGMVMSVLNKESAEINRRGQSQRTVLKLTEAQIRTVISQSTGDPRWFKTALGYRVLSSEKMNLKTLSTDDTGMTDPQIATRLMVGSMWSHVVDVELEAARYDELERHVQAQRGMAIEKHGRRRIAHWGAETVRAKVVTPGCCRSHAMKVLIPLVTSVRSGPLLGGSHVTPTVQTLIEVNYPLAVEVRAKASRKPSTTLESMARVADDLAFCDELTSPYAHREMVAAYAAEVRATTVAARCGGSRCFEGFTADQTKNLDACTRKISSQFYEHLSGVKKRNGRQRALRDYMARTGGAVAPVDVASEARVLGFWGQHVPVVELAPHHYARDAGLYAAVALHLDPAPPGALKALATWRDHEKRVPKPLNARSLAEWFSKRCTYQHFTASVAWTLAWSSLAAGLVGVTRPERLLSEIGAMLRAGMEKRAVVSEIEGRSLPKNWMRGRFPPAIGGNGAEVRLESALMSEANRVWSMAQSILAL